MGDGSAVYYVVHTPGGSKIDMSFRGLSKIPDELCAFTDLKVNLYNNNNAYNFS
jgi:hypothetical protein